MGDIQKVKLSGGSGWSLKRVVKKNHGSKKEIWLPQYRKAAKKPSGLTFLPRLALEDFDTSPKTKVK